MTLRQVTISDSYFLYQLLEERPLRANISHKCMPSYAEHCAFIESRPYAHWYVIIGKNGHRVGSIYLTRQNEIGVFVKSSAQGHGYAEKAIAELMHLHPAERYLANIAPHNEPSKALFTKLGFEPVQHTYVLCAASLSSPISSVSATMS